MKNTFLRRMLPLMMAVLCLIPAMALAMPDITCTDSSAYSWNETKKLLTVTGDDVVIETSVDNAEFDINVESGSLFVNGHVIGDVTVKGGTLSIIHGNWEADQAATLTGGLSVEGGEVYIEGLTIYGGHGSTEGVRLTKNSAITGGNVWITGGNDMEGGSPALTREAGATLSVSGEAWLRLASGVTILDDSIKSYPPDYTKPSAALGEADLDMLIWGSPVQMKAGNYDGSADKFKDWATVYKPGNMKGKSVIESFKGWKVTYDANGGTGSMEGAIVPDGVPYTVATDCGFTAPAGHSFANSWLVNDDTMKEYRFPVTADVTIKPVWKANQYTLKFVDEDGKEMDSITADYGAPITMAPSIPDKEGYTFVGWDGEIPQTMPAENLTLTAKWTKVNEYTLKFVDEDGTELGSITAAYGAPIKLPEDPVKEGYTFAGWDGDVPTTMPAGNVTLTAKWTKVETLSQVSLPQTGDPSSLLGWAALLGASAFSAKAIRRRKK